jgi:hypothetical protein
MPRQIDIPAQVVYEKIVYIEELPNVWVRASVGKTDVNGELLPNQTAERYTIEGNNLTELLTPNPSWSPNKPGGTYDNEDLWHFIDILRS